MAAEPQPRPRHTGVPTGLPAVRLRALTAAVALLLAVTLGGCRAFHPEAALVNKAPETYIIGAPTEHGGGYYRFHVYWYGRDEDGYIERFVWALSSGTAQDPRTDDDEEDRFFNPGVNASTLAVGHWTTRTDSIFNFTVDNGANPSAERTLHLVALDDRGAFDRTPARLHFFANSLGSPTMQFFRINGTDTVAMAPGAVDTVGYGHPYRLAWLARSLNIRGYGDETLALLDTLPPLTDGIVGYKWLIRGLPGEECDTTNEDCWHPRRFNESTNDSFSYFGDDTALRFANDGSATGTFQRLLPSGTIEVHANAIDIAGVEVAESERRFRFIVNFDPQTLLLDGETDWAHTEDPETYPYYIQLGDPGRTHHPFRSGDRIPDRTYVVVKALARDDPRDMRTNDDYRIGLNGYLQCSRSNYLGGVFNFASEASVIDDVPAWDAGNGGWYGDTLGFLTAPSSTFTINMVSVDELARRDGSPATLSFSVGYPPCLQCIELLPKPGVSTSAFDEDTACVESAAEVETHPCLAGVTDLRVTYAGDGPNDLLYYGVTNMMVHRDTGFLKVTESPAPGEIPFYYVLPSRLYKFNLLLHGQDDPRDAWAEPLRRMGAWRYQVSYACDPYNVMQDGGGNDEIRATTWGPPKPQTIDPATGVWKLEVNVAVPTLLVQQGPAAFRAYLNAAMAAGNAAIVDMIYDAVTTQFGEGTVDAVAVDQTICGLDPDRPARFNFFRNVRVPAGLPPGLSWRDCGLDGYFGNRIKDRLPLSHGAMSSLGGEPVRKRFRLTLVTPTGELVCSGD
ncbi:MAG: hypothetical protein IPO18_05210 [bacterium]|nr:hypothetical protein [bacterium]